MSIDKVKTQIVLAAMRGVTPERANEVDDVAWRAIEAIADTRERIAAIRFAAECGVISIEHKFLTTKSRDLARMLWNEFTDDICPETVPALPTWRREIVDTPPATKPDELTWHAKRLRKANLPLQLARVQFGEVCCGKIEWGDVEFNVDAEWDEDADCLRFDCGSTYAGWDPDLGVYLQYKDDLINNEHVARVAL